MALLRAHEWPGNIRELQSVLKQAFLRTHGAVLVAPSLPDLTSGPRRSAPATAQFDIDGLINRQLTPEASDLYPETHREVDRPLLTRILEYTKGNHRQAARILGVARQTMRLKLRALGLHVTQVVSSDEDDEVSD